MKQRKIASSLFISNFSQVLKITVNVFLIFLFVQENITAYIQHISRYLEMFLVFIADCSEDYLLWGIFEGKDVLIAWRIFITFNMTCPLDDPQPKFSEQNISQ